MTLIVSPLRHVRGLIETRRPSHVLTLISPDAVAPLCPEVPAHQHVTLKFNDIISPAEGLTPPDQDIVQAILDFGAGWNMAVPMLIHCFAGISRSTAAAYMLACHRAGPGWETEIATRLRDAAPTATPNSLMVALADDLLRREGRMIAAINEIGRGASASEGAPFELSGFGQN